MATEKRLLDDLDAQSSLAWTSESNAFVEDDNYASSASLYTVGEYVGGDFQAITQTPTSFTSFYVRFFDINSDHSNDTYIMRFYNLDSEGWIDLETFNSGNLLPTSLTTKDYTLTLSTYYAAAANKTSWLNSLAFRLTHTIKVLGDDRPEIGLAWAYFVYDYTPSADTQLDYERSHRGVARGANRGS